MAMRRKSGSGARLSSAAAAGNRAPERSASVSGAKMGENQTDGSGAPKAAPSTPSPSGYSNHAIHLVRTTQNNTLKLSQMADQKASILMGATFLVFSISVSRSLTGNLPWSLALLAVFAFASSLCAVMAVIPAVSTPAKMPGKPNNLFFGHFTHLDERQWTEDVLEDLKADETVFKAMLHDIYQNGLVLQKKKYRYLGLAYRTFIVGLILTLVAFGIEMAVTY